MASEIVRRGVKSKIKDRIYDRILSEIMESLVRKIEREVPEPGVIDRIYRIIVEGERYCSPAIERGDPAEAERCVDTYIAEREDEITDKIIKPLMPVLERLKREIEK